MYTYKLGGMLITDELYHDDLEAVTFGRKDQNELMHYGIKGQSWGKRRFQNEDGSLTMAGRNRYDVGDSRQAPSSHADYKSGVRNGVAAPTRSSGSYGSSMTGQGAKAQPVKAAGVSQQTRNDIATRTAANRQRISNTANTGRKAADSLFGRIGNWATNAANDVGKAATNAYNGASRAVNNAADWVGDRAKDVGNLISNQDEKQKMQDLIDKHYDPETNTFDSDGNYKKFDEARTAYLNHPLTAVSEAGKWVGDRAKDVGNAATNAWNDVSATARGVADSVGNHLTGNIDRNTAQALRDLADHQENPNAAFYSPMPKYSPENLRKEAEEYQRKADNSLFGRIGNAAKDVGNWATNAYNDASKAVTGAAQDVSDWFTGDKAGREAQRYDNVVQNFERNGDRNINEGIDMISKAINIKDKYPNVSEANFDKGIKQRDLGYDQHEIASQYGQKADEAQARYDAAPRQLLNAAGNWVSNAANDVGKTVSGAANAAGNAIGNAARDVGDWVGDRAQDVGNAVNGAAKDVANWGAGAVESGKNFFNNLFGGGNKEPEQPTLSDPNERMITENIIPEQRITEQRIPEQRITDSNSSMSDKPSNVSDEYWRDYTSNGGTRESYDREMNARKNSQNNGSSNTNSSISDKPDGVSEEYWREYTSNGGSRESYDKSVKAAPNYHKNENGGSGLLDDKPAYVSDEYWEQYKANGGTRGAFDAREEQWNRDHPAASLFEKIDYDAAQKQMNDTLARQNGNFASTSVVSGNNTVDTSRPHHFTYDPASGQTIVVYDDEKRR